MKNKQQNKQAHPTPAPTDDTRRDGNAISREMQLSIVRAEGDGDATVLATVSTETPVLEDVYYNGRWQMCYRILDHGPESVDLSRVADGMVVTDNHYGDQIGLLAVAISDRKLHGSIDFCTGERAQNIREDAVRGLRRNLSVDGSVDSTSYRPEGERDGYPVIRAMRWQPHRVAFVSLQADPKAGVGREHKPPQMEITMKEDTPPKVDAPVERKIDLDAIRKEASKTRSAEVVKMHELARFHDFPADELNAAVAEGKSFSDFSADVIEHAKKAVKPENTISRQREAGDVDVPERDAKRFSVMKVVRALIAKDRTKASFEFGLSDEIGESIGREASGCYVPHNAIVGRPRLCRDLTVAGGGSGSVATVLRPDLMIDMLRNRMATVRMGAQMLTGLQGDVAIPKQTGASTAYWVTEGNDVTESAQTIGQVTGTPHTVGATTDISRKLIKQSSLDIEMFVQEDLAKVVGLAIDLAGLAGTGADGQPTGITGTSGVNTPTIAAAGTATWAETLQFPGQIMADNADLGTMGWIIAAAVWQLYAGTDKATSTGQFIADTNTKTIAGYPYVLSQQVGANGGFFGIWDQLVYGMWGALDLNIDTASLSTSGGVRIVALQDVDVMVRNGQSFSYSTGISA